MEIKKFLALGSMAVALSLGMGAAQAATPGIDPAVKNELNTFADATGGSVAYRMFKKMDTVSPSSECAPAAQALQQDYKEYLTGSQDDVAKSLKADGLTVQSASAEQLNAKVGGLSSIGDRILKLRASAQTLNECLKAPKI